MWLGRPTPPEQRNFFYRGFNAVYNRLEAAYGRLMGHLVAHSNLSVICALILIGVGGSAMRVRYAPVTFRLWNPHERRESPAVVAFAPFKPRFPLLGLAGFLQFFTATFRGHTLRAEHAVNPTYPGP